MIDRILNLYKTADFDFRKFAFPDDPLFYLFDRWIEYYKMKYAICKAIEPTNILEVGVRYGYSCKAFLEACPFASYVGIDADRDSYGGVKGAVEWARKMAGNRKASFLVADTQSMTDFPGEHYGLIHIDGQQDGDGTYHDLEMALRKAEYILVDGVYWSRQNMLSSLLFTEKYRKLIEYAIVIPGYAGDLLIKVAAHKIMLAERNLSNKELIVSYTEGYYLDDCGGYDGFLKMRRSKDPCLLDDRLRGILAFVRPEKGDRILDVGCGRGELAYAMSLNGADVTGIDYSGEAITLARSTFFQSERNGGSLEFCQGDFSAFSFERSPFNKIVASDVVEHLDPRAFPAFLEQVKKFLSDDGMFIIHTAPNKLMYSSVYRRKRAAALTAGLYLPRNPRSLYEDLMHINEQTPAGLQRQLKKVFNDVCVWVSSETDTGKGLAEKLSWKEIREGQSIFAIAAKSSIDRNSLIDRVRQERLKTGNFHFKIELLQGLQTLPKASQLKIHVVAKNNSQQSIGSFVPFPVNVAYHWKDGEGNMLVFDGVRTPVFPKLFPGERRMMNMDIQTPSEAGSYFLELTLVQEGCFWFEHIQPDILQTIAAVVK